MNTLEQAREVSKRLHLGVSIANDRNIDKDFTVIAKAAGNTIDALLAELADERIRGLQLLADAKEWQQMLMKERAELSTLKAQQPVAWMNVFDDSSRDSYGKQADVHCSLDGAKRQIERHVSRGLVKLRTSPLYLAAGAQPAQEQSNDDLTIAYMSGFYEGKKAQEQRKVLSDKQIDKMFEEAEIGIYINDNHKKRHMELYYFGVRDCEAAHGIK